MTFNLFIGLIITAVVIELLAFGGALAASLKTPYVIAVDKESERWITVSIVSYLISLLVALAGAIIVSVYMHSAWYMFTFLAFIAPVSCVGACEYMA